MNKKKRTIIITSVVLALFLIMGIVYAILSDQIHIRNKFKVGTVHIDTKNLIVRESLTDTENDSYIAPGDIDFISWTSENIGTNAVLTRQTLEVRWTGNLDFYLYPANLSDEAIREDLNNIENGEDSQAIVTETITETTNNVQKVVGLRYSFVGDLLDGTSNTAQNSVSTEANYNLAEGQIDETINTDDSDNKKDEVAFKIVLSPKTSYLQQGKITSVKVKTEGMQYTGEASQSENWVAADVEEVAQGEEIND